MARLFGLVWFGSVLVSWITFSKSGLDKQSPAGWRLFWMILKGKFTAMVWQDVYSELG
jgi:hypothetical protein